jgi:hypothetical protein
MGYGVPIVAQEIEEICRFPDPPNERRIKSNSYEFLWVDVGIGRQSVDDMFFNALFVKPPAQAISAFVHLPRAQQSVERTGIR